MSSSSFNYTPSVYRKTATNVASGTVAALTVVMCGHPFDTMKVRLQTQSAQRPVYRGLADCFLKTLKWEGMGGLYKGVGSPLLGQMFFRATLFSSYYHISDAVAGKTRSAKGERMKTKEYFLCGALTGVIVSFVESPIDLFKTKMQVQIMRQKSGAAVQYRNVFHAGYLIMAHHGVRGAYQGLHATLSRNIPAFACFFGFYEMCRSAYIPAGGNVKDLKAPHLLLSGATGGLLYWLLNYPADVVKSAMQSDESDPRKRRFKGIANCVKKLYIEEGGWKRFYKGFTPCIMRAVPINAIQFFTLEKSRQFFSYYLLSPPKIESGALLRQGDTI